MKIRLLWLIGAIGLPALAGGIALMLFGGGAEGAEDERRVAIWGLDGRVGMATTSPLVLAPAAGGGLGVRIADFYNPDTGAFRSIAHQGNLGYWDYCSRWIDDDGSLRYLRSWQDWDDFYPRTYSNDDGSGEYFCQPNVEDEILDLGMILDIQTDVDCNQRLVLRYDYVPRRFDRETKCYIYDYDVVLWPDWSWPLHQISEVLGPFPAGSYSIRLHDEYSTWSRDNSEYLHEGEEYWILPRGTEGWGRGITADDEDVLTELSKWDSASFRWFWYVEWGEINGPNQVPIDGLFSIHDNVGNRERLRQQCFANKITPTSTPTPLPTMTVAEHQRIVGDIQATATAVSAQTAILISERDAARSALADSQNERVRLSAALLAAEAAKARMRDARDAAIAAKDAMAETLRRRSEAYQARIDQLRESNRRLQERINDLRARLRGR